MVLRAGFHGTVGQSSAQVVDGSLKFISASKNHLERDFLSDGNRKTWTWSCWVKKPEDEGFSEDGVLFEARTDSPGSTDANIFGIRWRSNGRIGVYDTGNFYISGTREFRDPSSFYHLVLSVDTTQASNNISLYVNGDLYSHGSYTQNSDTRVNSNAATHRIGARTTVGSQDGLFLSSQLSQTYFIDGQALGPGYFGFTDPLTNTWRPKKFRAEGTTVNDGTQWSSLVDVSNATVNNGSAANLFDGDTTTKINITSGYIEIDLSSRNVQAGPEGIEVYNNEGGAYTSYQVNGGEAINWQASAGWMSMGGANSKINTIRINYLSGGGVNAAFAFRVNGVTMVDSTTTNLAFGTNGFYLPMDGNSPIGQDKSGKGNDWTPVNFGGSNSVDKATGALPILEGAGGAVANVSVRTDTFSNNLVVAMPLVGITTDVSNLINSGTTAKTVTQTGSSSDIANSTEQSNFYGSSAKFQGNVSRLEISGGGGTDGDYDFGTGDFCMECWFYPTATVNTNNRLFCSRGDRTNYQLMIGSDKYLQFDIGGTNYKSANNVVSLNKWQHFAATRQSGTLRLFVDGFIVKEQASVTTDLDETTGIDIGYESGYSSYINGYMQDARVYKGVAKYTSNFVPASTNPDILPDTPSGVSGSSKLAKITDGSVTFDGTDHLTVADGINDFSFGTGAYTVEGYLYPTTLTGNGDANPRFFCCGTPDSSSNRNQLQIVMTASGQIRLDTNGANYTSTANDVVVNKWQHIAVTRDGSGNLKTFVDGRQVISQSSVNNDITNNDGISLGIEAGASSRFTGFMSNVRILKGTALYTSAFTPPERTLTNITNTKLLCCQSPSNVRLSPVAPNVGVTTTTRFNSNFESIPTTVNGLTVTNNSSVSTTSAGTNSYGFTNCADLSGSNSLSVNLGAIPQVTTIDIIFKVTGTTDNKYLFAISNTGLVRRTGSSLAWYNNDGDQTISTTPDDGEWHHLRVTPKSLYFDGVETKSTSSTPNIYVSANGYMALGAYRNDSGTIQYNGAVDIGLVRVMPGVDLGAPSSIPITTNGTLSSTETIPNDGVIYAADDAVASNFNPFNTDINTVRGQETGYPTWNPLRVSNQTLSNNNMTTTGTSGNVLGSMFTPTSGKFYWEVTAGSNYTMTGIQRENNYDMSYPGNSTGQIAMYLNNGIGSGQLYEGGSITSSWGGGNTGDVIGVALDMDNNKVYFYNNGRGLGAGGLTGTPEAVDVPIGGGYTANCRSGSGAYNGPSTINFGQKPFKHLPPDGYQPLNAANIRPETVIARPDQYVGIITYVGAGATKTFTGLNFGDVPDLVWMKNRDRTSYGDGTSAHNYLYDTVRGTGTGKMLTSSTNEIEGSKSTEADLDGFVKNGFRLDAASGTDCINNSGDNFVAWCWRAGGKDGSNAFNVDGKGYASAAAAGLTAGTLTISGASVGTKQGFSIIKYAGSGSNNTFPHGLTQAPNFYIIKCLDVGAESWRVYHSSITADYALTLNTNANASDSNIYFNDTEPTSTVASVYAGYDGVNNTGRNYIAYLWHDVPGLQKFGSYEGNGDTDGPYVELGFTPAILMLKNYDDTEHWYVYDPKRSPHNVAYQSLKWSSREAEETGSTNTRVDLLSNGFKLRQSNGPNNSNSYVYAAWAAAPAINLYGGQSNAR